MPNSILGGGFLSGPNGGILDLESPINEHMHTHFDHPSMNHHHHANVMSSLGNDHQPNGLMEPKSLALKGVSMNFAKRKDICVANTGNTSEEDEPSFAEGGHGEHYNGQKGKKGSPWQRMKWTDNVVRLLIAVVACVGDDGTLEGVDGLKRKYGTLQKKGKWKTVSEIMISKGCFVSPQQCEDKFNDLNKRYKRLNEILGRGTSCRVVENPALMDSMPHLSAKMKDVVRKILSSKHLFYQEMCAYHNGQTIPNCQDFDLRGGPLSIARCSKDQNGSDEEADENDDSEDNEMDNEDKNNADVDAERMQEYHQDKRLNLEDEDFWPHSGGMDSFEVEMSTIFQEPTKSQREQREWIKNRMLELLEQRVTHQAEALELEKRHFKWQRFCLKKDRELERSRLENERKKLDNERMELLLKQKEFDLDFKRSETPSNLSLGIDRLQGRDQIDLCRPH